MFPTSSSASTREQRPQTPRDLSPSFPPSPPVLQLSGRKRARSSLPRLSPSLSCPHLSLLATGTSSPPSVTSALAFGSTTPTAEISWSSGGSLKKDEPPKSAGIRRLSMPGFPWDDRATSGRKSPAAEMAGNIARRSRPVTPPAQLIHANRADTAATLKDRSCSRSSLRLELPAPGIDNTLGAQIERRHSIDPNACVRHRGIGGQPLLGLAYPTTPDIGHSTTLCGACKEEAPGAAGEDVGSSSMVVLLRDAKAEALYRGRVCRFGERQDV